MTPLEIACAVLVPLLWGMQYTVIKAGLVAFPPLFFVALRFSVVAAILLPFVGWPTRRDLRLFFVISIFVGGLNFGLVFVGLTRTPASVTGIANQLWTPLTLLFAWPLLGERPSLRAMSGVAIAFGGVALAVLNPRDGVPIGPTLLIVGSAAALAIGSVLSKFYGPFDPLKLMAWVSAFTVPQVLTVSGFAETGQVAAIGKASPEAWMALAYTIVFGAIIGFGLWFWLIARCPIARVAPFTLLQSPFAIAAGVMFAHEPLTLGLMAGAIVCIAGVAVTQHPSRSHDRPALIPAPKVRQGRPVFTPPDVSGSPTTDT